MTAPEKAETAEDLRKQLTVEPPPEPETPEAAAAENAARETPPPAKEEDDLDPDKVEDLKVRSHIIRTRQRLSEEREAREKAEKEAEELRKGRGTEPGQEPAGAGKPGAPAGAPSPQAGPSDPEKRHAENVKIFDILNKATAVARGEPVQGFEIDEDKASAMRTTALEVIGSMTAGELMRIADEARQQSFGEASDEIFTLATKQLALAEAKERDSSAKAETQNREIQTVFAKVYEKYPALKIDLDAEGKPVKQTEESKFVQNWIRENVGTSDQPGFFYTAAQTAGNIPKLFDFAMRDFEAGKNKGAASERDQLQATLGKIRNPEAHSRGVGQGMKESDILRAEILSNTGS